MDLNNDYYDPEFDTKAEEIPGSYIIQREIRKAITGKDFFINDEDTGEAIRLTGISINDFHYYYKIWENYHYFGLPHNSGWSEERQWLLEFLKIFEKNYNSCKNLIEVKMSKKINGQ
jgi:hypothetical protein